MLDYQQVTRPYPGLRPFEHWEAEVFFGRDAHIDRLLEILKAQRFLAVIGHSGSGKSSLVRAGLLPLLPLGAIGTGSDWRIAIMRPGDRPLHSLAQAVSQAYDYDIPLGNGPDTHTANSTASLEAELHRGPLGLVRLVEDLRKSVSDHEASLLVLVDQFEEIFTYAAVGHQQANEADAFVDLLLHARDAREARLFIVLTMRTDFLGNCVRFLKLPDAINRAQYLTPRLNRDELNAVIAGPARLFGVEINPDLVVELTNAIGGDSDQLPILQHALARMWAARPAENSSLGFSDLKRIGGLEQALTGHAEEILQGLESRQKVAAEWLFRAITEQRGAETGGQAVRRPQTLQQIEAWSGIPWENFVPVLQAFANPDANFLNYKGQPGDPVEAGSTVIDLSHEALIRQWVSLRVWVGTEANAAKEYRLLKDRAQDEKEGKAELLRGADLARALEWLNKNMDLAPDWGKFKVSILPSSRLLTVPTQAWADRYTQVADPGKADQKDKAGFAEVKDFILRSHVIADRVQKRERTIQRSLVALSLACLCLAGGTGWLAWETDQQRIRVEAQYLWHPLRFGLYGEMDNIQREGLLALASAGERQRKVFLEALRKDTNLATSFSSHSPSVIGAAVGIDPQFRTWIIDMLRPPLKNDNLVLARARVLGLMAVEADMDMDELLGVIAKTTDVNDGESLRKGLMEMVARLEPGSATALADKLIQVIEESKDDKQIFALGEGLAAVTAQLEPGPATALADKLIQAIEKSKDDKQIFFLGKGLAVVAAKLHPEPATALADKLIQAIEKSKDDQQLSALGQGLAAVAAQLEPGLATTALADTLVQAIQKVDYPRQFVALFTGLRAVAAQLEPGFATALTGKLIQAIEKSNYLSKLLASDKGLAVAAPLEPGSATALADQLVQAIEKSNYYDELFVLSIGLAAVAAQVEPGFATTLADKLVQDIEITNDDDKFFLLGEDLAAVAAQLEPGPATALADKLVQVTEKSNGYSKLSSLSKGFATVAAQLEPGPAMALADKLVQAIEKSNDYSNISFLGQGLAAVAAQLEPGPATVLADKLVQAIEKFNDFSKLSSLGEGLAAVVAQLETGPATALADKLVQAIEKSNDYSQRSSLNQGLVVVAAQLEPESASALAEKMVQVMEKSNDGGKLSDLGKSLAAVAAQLEAESASSFADKLVQAIEKTNDDKQLFSLGQGLTAVVAKLEPGPALEVAKRMKVAITSARRGDQIAVLMEAVAPLMGRLKLDTTSAGQWIELCKYPFAPREAIADAVRRAHPDAPAKDKGFWAFIDWAKKKFTLDLTTPLIFPPPLGA